MRCGWTAKKLSLLSFNPMGSRIRSMFSSVVPQNSFSLQFRFIAVKCDHIVIYPWLAQATGLRGNMPWCSFISKKAWNYLHKTNILWLTNILKFHFIKQQPLSETHQYENANHFAHLRVPLRGLDVKTLLSCVNSPSLRMAHVSSVY